MRTVNLLGRLLLGLILLLGGLLIAVEAIAVAAGRDGLLLPLDRWHDGLQSLTPADSRFLVLSIVVGLVGLVLLAFAWRPWPPELVATVSPQGTPWWMARASVERRAEVAAAAIPGVHAAHASVRGPGRRFRVRLAAEADPDRRDPVRDAVTAELHRLGAPPETEVTVAIRRRRVT